VQFTQISELHKWSNDHKIQLKDNQFPFYRYQNTQKANKMRKNTVFTQKPGKSETCNQNVAIFSQSVN